MGPYDHQAKWHATAAATLLRAVCVGAITLTLFAASYASAQSGAQTFGGLLGGLLQRAIVQDALKTWQRVPQPVQNCLIENYHINPSEMARQGVRADDSRVAPRIQSCQAMIAQSQEREAAISKAASDWSAVDSEIIGCINSQGGTSVDQWTHQGVGPDDPRAVSSIEMCRQSLAQAHQRMIEQQQLAERERERAAAEAVKAHRAELAQEAARKKALIDQFGANQALAIQQKKVSVGMSKAAVLAARGNPIRIVRIPPNDELWVYSSDRISISNGKVTYIGH